MGEIKKIEPWKSYSLYNVYKINPKVFGSCAVKAADERKPALRCDADAINAYLAQLPLERFKLVTWPTDPGFGGPIAPAVSARLTAWMTQALGA